MDNQYVSVRMRVRLSERARMCESVQTMHHVHMPLTNNYTSMSIA